MCGSEQGPFDTFVKPIASASSAGALSHEMVADGVIWMESDVGSCLGWGQVQDVLLHLPAFTDASSIEDTVYGITVSRKQLLNHSAPSKVASARAIKTCTKGSDR